MAAPETHIAYTLAVIRSVMNEKQTPPMPEGVTLDSLFRFARAHNVEALVYGGLKTLGLDSGDPVWRSWENRCAMLLTQGIVQLAQRDRLCQAMTGANIPLLPVKGCWLKELYPRMEYRQMSDLDMLIPPEREREARDLMLSLGYQTQSFEDTANHAAFFLPPYTEVELHNSLLTGDSSYYADVWRKAQPVEGCSGLFRLKREDEYIYYLLHLNKHLEDGGTGIRSVLDSLVYRRVWPDMDREYLRMELEGLGLWELTLGLEALADAWFATGDPVPKELVHLAERILGSGAYGTMENRAEGRLDRLKEKYKNPFIRGVVYWVARICLPRQELEHTYPVLKKLPVLLPLFWIYRAVMKFAKHPRRIWEHVKLVFRKDPPKE